MNWGRYSSAEKNTADISSTVRQAALKLRLPITSRGISAASPMRRSTNPKHTSKAPHSATSPMMRASPQPQSVTWSSATSSETSPIERVATPA